MKQLLHFNYSFFICLFLNDLLILDVREKVIEKQEALKSAKSHFEEYKLNISGNSR